MGSRLKASEAADDKPIWGARRLKTGVVFSSEDPENLKACFPAAVWLRDPRIR
jgi:hypothetical protein